MSLFYGRFTDLSMTICPGSATGEALRPWGASPKRRAAMGRHRRPDSAGFGSRSKRQSQKATTSAGAVRPSRITHSRAGSNRLYGLPFTVHRAMVFSVGWRKRAYVRAGGFRSGGSTDLSRTLFKDEFSIKTRVRMSRRTIDRIDQTVHILALPEKPQFTTIRAAHLVRDGRRWRPLGINYMPSSGIGLEDRRRFERWLPTPARRRSGG